MQRMNTYILISIVAITTLVLVIIACARKPHAPANETPDELHNRLFQAGCDLIKPYMMLHGVNSRNADTRRGKADLKKGIGLLTQVVQMNPANWPAFWTMGKAYQAMGASVSACDAFAKAYALKTDNPDVAREYMFECLNIGRTKEGLDLAQKAIAVSPDDVGLKANLALALLIDGQVTDAASVVDAASKADPSDRVTQDLKRIIGDVRSGKRPQPHKYGDISGVER
jgi:tetratricopeptide (TPR) repeat protein